MSFMQHPLAVSGCVWAGDLLNVKRQQEAGVDLACVGLRLLIYGLFTHKEPEIPPSAPGSLWNSNLSEQLGETLRPRWTRVCVRVRACEHIDAHKLNSHAQ